MAGNTSDIKDGAPQNIVGFEDDALKILERLDGKPKHLDVISIVGMPGIAFPEDHEVYVPKLVWLWIAEGFIEKTSGVETVEDVAEEYLMDLIERSLVIISSRCFNGGVKSCRIHDLLHDLCLRKAEEESFMQIILNAKEESFMQIIRRRFGHFFSIFHSSCYCSSSSPFENKFNRLSINSHLYYDFPFEDYPTICSLLIFYPYGLKANIDFQHLKLLRVLDLGTSCLISSYLYSEIGQLVRLRYLALGSLPVGPTCHFPQSLYKLKNLETLVSSTYVPTSAYLVLREEEKTYVDLFQFKKLRHLHISPHFYLRLSTWPNNIWFSDLQTMSFPILLTDNSCTIFRSTPDLRKLGCSCSKDTIRPLLRELVFLVKLEKLKMSLYPEFTYARLLDLPASLKRITLSAFCTDWEEISKLARLPNLEKLKLISMICREKFWDTYLLDESSFQPFPKLKFLKFESLDIKQWNASVDHFPSLERLVLIRCYDLKEIPSDLGEIPTLKTIEVNKCNHSLDCLAREILEEQQDKGNEQLEIFIYPKKFR